jgi:hypothetical protein
VYIINTGDQALAIGDNRKDCDKAHIDLKLKKGGDNIVIQT